MKRIPLGAKKTGKASRTTDGIQISPRNGGWPWKKEKIYFDGESYFRDILREVLKAKSSVEFESYIFEKGALADRVVEALLKAAARGVRVRVIVDGVGSADFSSHYGSRLKSGGVQIRVYRSWSRFLFYLFKEFRWMDPVESWRRFHFLLNGGQHRDHRKLYMVDGRQIWIGSFNISDWHDHRYKKNKTWRDTGIRLWDVNHPVFRMAFEIAWEDPWPRWRQWKHHEWLRQSVLQDVAESPIRVTLSRKLRIAYRKELLDRFELARRRIWVMTPYFVPTRVLLNALAHAARRGCDVRLILPGKSDVPMVQWVSTAFYPMLVKAGCRLYHYRKTILHAKTLFVDSWILVGSSNLDHRSLRKDLEINVVPRSLKSIQTLEKQYQKDLKNSEEITWLKIQKQPLVVRLLSWVFFRFRFWF